MRTRRDTLHSMKHGAIFGFVLGTVSLLLRPGLDAQHLGYAVTFLVGTMIGGVLLFACVSMLRHWFFR